MSDRTSFVRSAKLIAIWTLASRVTGLTRDILLNAQFGQGWVQDAFNFGFTVPNLFRRLFGEGALSAVFVPQFSEVLNRDGRDAAWSLLGKVLARLTLVLVALTAAIEVGLAVWLLAAPPSEQGSLQLLLTGLMLPFMVSICLVALFSSLLNCLGVFGAPAAMPIVLNLCMIAGIVLSRRAAGGAERQVIWVALSVLAAGVVQLLLLWPALRRVGAQMPLSLARGDPSLQAMQAAMLPVLLGQGVLSLNTFIDGLICTSLSHGPGTATHFSLAGIALAYPLEAGALTAITNAQRLYQFPLGVLAISLATAALPTFSRLASAGDTVGLRAALGRALRLAVFEGLPCGVMLFVLAEPVVRLLFQYGQYTAEHTTRAAAVLRWYGLGVAAFSLQHVVLRGYYSLKDTHTPMWLGAGAMVFNVAVSATLIWHPAVREQAFGLSATISTCASVACGLWLLRRRMGGRVGARALAGSIARTLICTALAAGAAWWVGGLVGGAGISVAAGESLNTAAAGAIPFATRALEVGAPLATAIAVYFAAALALRMEEPRWLLGRGPGG